MLRRRVRQEADGIYLDQEEYVNKWLEEIFIEKDRVKHLKSKATAGKIGSLRATLGTLSWKASETGPHHEGEVSLFLLEVPQMTVQTLVNVNKLVQEVKKEASKKLWFPRWGPPWTEIATVVWADASQSNRPNGSSTIAYVAGYAPKTILQGEEVSIALVAGEVRRRPGKAWAVTAQKCRP